MVTNPGDGIYETRANWYKQKGWPKERWVYIQGDTVRLVEWNPKPEALSRAATLFGFNHWFEANDLGSRIGDLPPNFDIRAE